MSDSFVEDHKRERTRQGEKNGQASNKVTRGSLENSGHCNTSFITTYLGFDGKGRKLLLAAALVIVAGIDTHFHLRI